MPTEEQRKIATSVLQKGKTIAVKYFPRFKIGNDLDFEIIDAWAEELGTRNYPVQLWEKAVSHWVNHEAQHGDIATTGDIIRAAKHIWGKWADDPATAGIVETWRLTALDRKYQRTVPGYKPGSIFPTTDDQKQLPDDEAFHAITRRLKQITRNRTIQE